MQDFIISFNHVSNEVHKTAVEKGWWEKERNEGELIALEHSELSEGLEALRKNKRSNKIPGFLGIEEELADCIIRIMDHAVSRNYRLSEALIAKIEFNKSRSYKHGGKNF